jgi:hypothetical protein
MSEIQLRGVAMGIALFTVSGLFSPLQAFMGWLSSPISADTGARRAGGAGVASPVARTATSHAVRPTSLAASRPVACAIARPIARPHAASQSRRPLRVLRVVERNAAPASAGRMLISGRMADVCAELDRLAAKEAAQP